MIPALWAHLKDTVVFYHGTSKAFIEGIRESGLSGSKKPLEEGALDLFYRVYKRVEGSEYPLARKNHQSNPCVYVSGDRSSALFYGSQPSEVVTVVAAMIPNLLSKGREMLSPRERADLEALKGKADALIRDHKPELLEIRGQVLELYAAARGQTVISYLAEELNNFASPVTVQDFIDSVFRGNEFELPKVPPECIRF